MLTEHIENDIDAIEDLLKINNIKNYQGEINIIIDTSNSRIIVIDNSTGIIDPIWIMENREDSYRQNDSDKKISE